MTVDQSVILVAPDGGEASSWTGWLSADDMNEAFGGEPDDHAETAPEALVALPAWPRVYPGL